MVAVIADAATERISVMAKESITDSLVEIEIERLNSSDYVKLYRKVKQIKERRKQYLYSLRWMEKQGRAFAESGYTLENAEQMLIEAENQLKEDGDTNEA